MDGGSVLDAHREAVAAAVSSLRALPTDLWRAASRDLGDLVGEVAVLAPGLRGRDVAVVRESVDRGEPGSGPRARTAAQWLRAHAPSWRSGGSAQVVAVAESFAVPGNAPVKAAVESGRLRVAAAATVVGQADALRPLLAAGVEETVVAGLVDVAADHGPATCRQLRGEILARHGREGVLQAEQNAAARFVSLSRPMVDDAGIADYRLTLDQEGRAALEAALGPLSAPRPTDGEPDVRPTERRRGEALVGLVRPAVAAGSEVGSHARTALLVQVGLDTLRSGLTGAGTTVGDPSLMTHLAPETVRRLACDTEIVPTVLGTAGEVLELGRARRLFSPGQVRRLWLRDHHCTFPGCDLQARWTDAHHLQHWVDGGRTDLDNAALLCTRHHTVVHRRRLTGRVTPAGVEWDLTTGSYDLLLAERAAREPA